MDREISLPVGSHPEPLEFAHFPARHQAVIWRNWGLVPIARLARILRATPRRIVAQARLMGLPPCPPVDPLWLVRGYATLIRQNWHLLPYSQLLELLGWTAARLDYSLRDDDFLWGKLGSLKPNAKPVRLAPLTPDERRRTRQLRMCLQRHFPHSGREHGRAFAFLHEFRTPPKPKRLAPTAPRAGEAVLDASWRLAAPCAGSRIDRFADGFLSRLRDRWGLRLGRTVGLATDGPAVELRLRPALGGPAESHAITVRRDGIRVDAVDEVGLLRGLQWLESAMEKRGGPYLKCGRHRRRTVFDLRMVYPYCALYGDPLLDPEFTPPPDGLLARYAELGINGIWLQAVLYRLVPLAGAPELSRGCAERLENLRRLTDRAADFGIGVYLYLNEPRGMPLSFFKAYPDWKGVLSSDQRRASLCTSRPAVREWLRHSVAAVFRQAPGLAGVFTITMSENPTHCWSHVRGRACPRCARRDPAGVIAEVNATIAEGVWSVKPDARVMAWTWGWHYPGVRARTAIAGLPPGSALMCTSEEAMPVHVGGVNSIVYDYSIAHAGPGLRAQRRWSQARARGLSTVAKVQLNTTWQCAGVPYLPVMERVERHVGNLRRTGVRGLMLSWTLGGCPSPNLKLASRFYWNETAARPGRELAPFAAEEFGRKAARQVQAAWQLFSAAIQEFPFLVPVAYLAPQNVGPANLLFEKPTGYHATMVGFPYDDLDGWRCLYSEDAFESQFDKLSATWGAGLAALRAARRHVEAGRKPAFDAHERVAIAAYLHFRSTFLQITFVRLRNRLEAAWDHFAPAEQQRLCARLLAVLDEEIALAKRLYRLVLTDATLGFEATNQYVYEPQALREKVVNCEHLRAVYQRKIESSRADLKRLQ